jgi:hypothetical protein
VVSVTLRPKKRTDAASLVVGAASMEKLFLPMRRIAAEEAVNVIRQKRKPGIASHIVGSALTIRFWR